MEDGSHGDQIGLQRNGDKGLHGVDVVCLGEENAIIITDIYDALKVSVHKDLQIEIAASLIELFGQLGVFSKHAHPVAGEIFQANAPLPSQRVARCNQAFVESMMPDYRERKTMLRGYGTY